MRPQLAAVLVASLALVPALSRPATAEPDRRVETSEVRGGFSKRFAAGTVAATLPRATPTTALPAAIKVTVEIGAD